MSTFMFHAYRDSEAPGVRDAAIGVEPVYNDDELPAALAWAAVAEWGAMYVRTRSQATFVAFEAEAEQLGYRLTHVYRGGHSWRFRVERLACRYVATCGCVCGFQPSHVGMHECQHIGPRAFGEHASHAAGHWSDGLAQSALPGLADEQLALF